MAGRLDGKVCVITGAGGGMGREAALLFTAEGAKVCAADMNLAAAEESLYAAGERILRRRIHPEGFHELTLSDPDGNCVRLIAWPSE